MAQRDLSDLFFRLSRSAFRSRFYLKPRDREYVWTKGMDTVLGKIAEDGVDVSGGEWQSIAFPSSIAIIQSHKDVAPNRCVIIIVVVSWYSFKNFW